MKVIVTSILVDDQDKALKFYTEKLGFVKKTELPVGDAKWLTVISPEGNMDVEVLLEPNWNPSIQIDGKPAGHVLVRQGLGKLNVPVGDHSVELSNRGPAKEQVE